MMARVQIALAAEDHKRARARAAELGISFAEYVRRVVARDLERRPRGDVASLFDLGDSGGSDIARFKDEYIGDAVEREHERETG